MNKNAQVFGKLAMIFFLIVFGLLYFGGVAGGMKTTACQSVSSNNITGVEGFVYCNMNLFIFLFFLIALAGVTLLA